MKFLAKRKSIWLHHKIEHKRFPTDVKMKSFDIISFDLFNTLVYVNRPVYDPITSMAEALLQSSEFTNIILPQISINDVIESYYSAIRKEMRDRTKEKEFSNAQLLLDVWEQIDIEIDQNIKAAADQIIHYYFDSLMHLILPFPGNHEILTQLKKERYTLVLSSNHSFAANGWAVLRKYNLIEYFSKIIFSGDIGWKKPSLKFFKTAFSGLGEINKRRILHIGDDPVTDLQGALNFGIKALWMRPPHKNSTTPPTISGIEGIISDLKELYEFL
ncbi:MAG: HAD family hydrolase [Candidatus Hodarchaeota archaeon]